MPKSSMHYSKTYESDYFWYLGGWVTPRTAAILAACAKASGWGRIRLSQGGLSSAVFSSALTHRGLAVGDIAIDGRPKTKVWALCAALKRSGILPFPRGYGGDPWRNMKHIHFVEYPPTHAHWQAQDQVTEYLNGHGDGLVGPRKYNGPSTKLDYWKHGPYNPANIRGGPRTYYVDVRKGTTLLGLTVDRGVRYSRKPGFRIKTTHQVYRWGRWNAVSNRGTYYAVDYLSTKKPS